MNSPGKEKGEKAGRMLEREAEEREEEIERKKGSHQKKGAERFEDFEDKTDRK